MSGIIDLSIANLDGDSRGLLWQTVPRQLKARVVPDLIKVRITIELAFHRLWISLQRFPFFQPADDLMAWLERRTEVQVLDYYHAAGYVDLAVPAFCKDAQQASGWAAVKRENQRDEPQAALDLLATM